MFSPLRSLSLHSKDEQSKLLFEYFMMTLKQTLVNELEKELDLKREKLAKVSLFGLPL